MIEVVGEALVDLVADPSGQVFRAHPGGSPTNVAVGLARLGVPVRLTTRIGDDAFGRLVRRHLDASGVRLAEGSVTAGAPTSLAVATLDDAGVAGYDFRVAWDLPPLPPPGREVEWVHTGSLATALEPGAAAVRDLLRAAATAGVPVSYDPNPRPALVPDVAAARRAVEDSAALATVVKASEDDIALLYPGRGLDDVAAAWLGGRTELVVVTRGPRGAFALTEHGAVTVPAPAVEVVDTVGAGDAFMAALLAALREQAAGGPVSLDADGIRAVVRPAVAAASLACARPGAHAPTRSEIRAALTTWAA